MVSLKKVINAARKWQKLAAMTRERITTPIFEFEDVNVYKSSSTSLMAEKGHFVVYTADRRRFVLPLVYLNNMIVRELFTLAEEEFGWPANGPLTLPCDAVFLEYAVTLIRQHVAEDLEKALLMSIATLYVQQNQTNQQLVISCGC